MSVWFSRKTIECWETDYDPEEPLNIDLATNGDLIRIGVHDEDDWLWDVMLDRKQAQALVGSLEKLLFIRGRWWKRKIKKWGMR